MAELIREEPLPPPPHQGLIQMYTETGHNHEGRNYHYLYCPHETVKRCVSFVISFAKMIGFVLKFGEMSNSLQM